MNKLIKRVAQILFLIARSSVGAWIIGWSFAHLTAWMPINKLHETELLIAFYHPRPTAKTHILLVPKRPLRTLMQLSATDTDIFADLYATVQLLVKQLNLEQSGYSLIVNGGKRQDVMQVHWHLTADQ